MKFVCQLCTYISSYNLSITQVDIGKHKVQTYFKRYRDTLKVRILRSEPRLLNKCKKP